MSAPNHRVAHGVTCLFSRRYRATPISAISRRAYLFRIAYTAAPAVLIGRRPSISPRKLDSTNRASGKRVSRMTPTAKAAPSSPSPPLPEIHDLSHQILLVREGLQSEKRRLGFFLGAGCPLGIYDPSNTKSLKHIPDVAGLTDQVAASLKSHSERSKMWTQLSTACSLGKSSRPTVEHILTQLRTICALQGTTAVDGMPLKSLADLDLEICKHIATVVGKALPGHTTSYHRLAAWIGHIDRFSPVEVFTPNYDLLLEEALETYKVPYFDGFVGTREPFFDLPAIEQDAIPARWTRLWKLHGSINWVKRNNDTVFRSHPAPADRQLLIYPSHLKYDQSRRMPYLAMLDRLKTFLRELNSVLLICGYSFADEHLNEVIIDGLRSNRSAQCFALLYPEIESPDSAAAIALASRHANLSVLAATGAVIGTRIGTFKPIDRSSPSEGCGFFVDPPPTGSSKTKTATGPARCSLGDFHHFARFLEAQFGVKANSPSPS